MSNGTSHRRVSSRLTHGRGVLGPGVPFGPVFLALIGRAVIGSASATLTLDRDLVKLKVASTRCPLD